MVIVKILASAAIPFLFIGCFKKYKWTIPVCNNLYVEVYNVNPAGVYTEYLTDSLHFRLFVGEIDLESRRYIYRCKGDSILIETLASDTSAIKLDSTNSFGVDTTALASKLSLDTMFVIATRTFSISSLKKNGKYQ